MLLRISTGCYAKNYEDDFLTEWVSYVPQNGPSEVKFSIICEQKCYGVQNK